jgi:hypothetical protein
LLAGCGGGGGESPSNAPSSNETSPTVKAMAVVASPGGGPSQAWWGSQFCPDDARLYPTINSKDVAEGRSQNVLLSRHAQCYTVVSTPQTITVDLMRLQGSTNWTRYIKNTPKIDEVRTFTWGDITLETQVRVYGAPSKLEKTYDMRMRVTKVDTRGTKRDIPPGTSGVDGWSVRLSPAWSCSVDGIEAGVSAQTCRGLPVDKADSLSPSTPITLALRASTTFSAWSSVSIPVKWAFDASKGGRNIETFTVRPLNPLYTVLGSDRQSNTPADFNVGLDSYEAQLITPRLRCDVGVVHPPEQGCVYPDAAAVWVHLRRDAPEAADHIKQAQNADPRGAPQGSPGVFILKSGTRALWAGSDYISRKSSPKGYPLERIGDDAVKRANRRQACGPQADAYHNKRPYWGSDTCAAPGISGCSCDEYPFAASKTAAPYDREAYTSVKGINAPENYRSGALMLGFFRQERVLPSETGYVDPYWVYID